MRSPYRIPGPPWVLPLTIDGCIGLQWTLIQSGSWFVDSTVISLVAISCGFPTKKMWTRTLGGSFVYTLVNKHSSMDHVPTCCRSNYYLKMMTRVIAMLVCPRVFFFMAMFNQGVGRCFQHKLQLLISKDIIYYTILYIHILEMYNHVYKSGCFWMMINLTWK